MSAVTFLEFDSGPVAIDESNSRVWRELASWSRPSDERSVHMRCQAGVWEAELRHGEISHIGTSRQSMPDAAAQALMVAYMAGEV